jgi:hypothetical protein
MILRTKGLSGSVCAIAGSFAYSEDFDTGSIFACAGAIARE